MDISGISTAKNNLNLSVEVSAAVLSMSLDTIEKTGDSMIKMMEQSVQPELGSTIDTRI